MQLAELITAFATYRSARQQLLQLLARPASNRDPLAEFSEALMAHLTGGMLAASPVQKGYDVITPEGKHMQVKYLANGAGPWVNEHPIKITSDMDCYAVVIFINLQPSTAIVFPPHLTAICERLGKRHNGDHDTTLTLTQRNYYTLLAETSDFEALGVQVHDLTTQLVPVSS